MRYGRPSAFTDRVRKRRLKAAADAWVIWDPFYADAQLNLRARVLVDGTGLVDDSVFLCFDPFRRRENTDRFCRSSLKKSKRPNDGWRPHPDDAARQLAEATALPLTIWQTALSRHNYGVKAVDEKAIDSQQSIADTFFSLGLLPAKENVASAVWPPSPKQKALVRWQVQSTPWLTFKRFVIYARNNMRAGLGGNGRRPSSSATVCY